EVFYPAETESARTAQSARNRATKRRAGFNQDGVEWHVLSALSKSGCDLSNRGAGQCCKSELTRFVLNDAAKRHSRNGCGVDLRQTRLRLPSHRDHTRRREHRLAGFPSVGRLKRCTYGRVQLMDTSPRRILANRRKAAGLHALQDASRGRRVI